MFTKKNFSKKRRKFEFMVSEAQSISKYLQLESIWKVTLKEKLLIRVAAAAKSLQSCPTLCNPMDGSPPGSPIPGILQARTLEWAAISFSNAWKWKVKVKSLSRVRLPNPTEWSLPGSPVHGIFQARVMPLAGFIFFVCSEFYVYFFPFQNKILL